MQKEMWVSILAHQLKGIMFHADAYGVACLHGYKRLKMAHCKQEREESNTFMVTRCKSIEHLGEIIDIPPITRIAVPHTASPSEIAEMWLKWEMETAELYSKAMIENPECKMWIELHKSATDEIRYISRMHF